MPHTEFILHDVEEEEIVFHLCHQSENLAIGLGLIKTAPCTRLQIRKNLQVFLKIAPLPQSSFEE